MADLNLNPIGPGQRISSAAIGANFDMVEAELERVDTELENKMNGAWTIYRSLDELSLTQTASMDDVINVMKGYSILIVPLDSAPKLTPYPDYSTNTQDGIGLLTITKWSKARTELQFTSHHAGIYLGNYFVGFYNTGMFAWGQLLFAGPPQRNSLPESAGYNNYDSIYYKDGFGAVHIQGHIQKISGYFEHMEIVSVLPMGFRPDTDTERGVTFNPPFVGGLMDVLTNGNIRLRLDGTTASIVWFDFSFYP